MLFLQNSGNLITSLVPLTILRQMGRPEPAVKIAKKLIKKAKRDHQHIHLAILNWRNTPSEGNNLSPVQKLYSHDTKTLLPTTSELLQTRVPTNITEYIEFPRQKAKAYFDKGVAHPLPS